MKSVVEDNKVEFKLLRIKTEEIEQYKTDMQAAFQTGFENVFGKTDAVILPEVDIDKSLNAEGSVAYKAVVDGEMVGGTVVVINEITQLIGAEQDICVAQSATRNLGRKGNRQGIIDFFGNIIILSGHYPFGQCPDQVFN